MKHRKKAMLDDNELYLEFLGQQHLSYYEMYQSLQNNMYYSILIMVAIVVGLVKITAGNNVYSIVTFIILIIFSMKAYLINYSPKFIQDKSLFTIEKLEILSQEILLEIVKFDNALKINLKYFMISLLIFNTYYLTIKIFLLLIKNIQ